MPRLSGGVGRFGGLEGRGAAGCGPRGSVGRCLSERVSAVRGVFFFYKVWKSSKQTSHL